MGRIYEVGLEMGSVAVIYMPSFIMIGSDIQKLARGIRRQPGDGSRVITIVT
jgi:hypothetical protein